MRKIAFQNVSRLILAFSTSVIQELSCFINQAHLGMTWVLPGLILLQRMFPHLQTLPMRGFLKERKKKKIGLNNNKNNNKKSKVVAISPVLSAIKAGQGGWGAIQECPCCQQGTGTGHTASFNTILCPSTGQKEWNSSCLE